MALVWGSEETLRCQSLPRGLSQSTKRQDLSCSLLLMLGYLAHELPEILLYLSPVSQEGHTGITDTCTTVSSFYLGSCFQV